MSFVNANRNMGDTVYTEAQIASMSNQAASTANNLYYSVPTAAGLAKLKTVYSNIAADSNISIAMKNHVRAILIDYMTRLAHLNNGRSIPVPTSYPEVSTTVLDTGPIALNYARYPIIGTPAAPPPPAIVTPPVTTVVTPPAIVTPPVTTPAVIQAVETPALPAASTAAAGLLAQFGGMLQGNFNIMGHEIKRVIVYGGAAAAVLFLFMAGDR